jgi:hypothetical protein
VSLTSGAEVTEALFWGPGGGARMPDAVDVPAAYAAAIDALLDGGTPFDASFGREVVRLLAAAEEQLGRRLRSPNDP